MRKNPDFLMGDATHTSETIGEEVRERLGEMTPSERRVARTLLATYPTAGLESLPQLAEGAGVTGPKTWRAYLSTSEVDAKDRIGAGPWFNAKGEKIADDIASLHSDANNLTKQTALDEKGNVINGRGDTPNKHDILTGSNPDGTRIADQTCGDWTLSGAEGAAMMGHSDRTGLDDSAAAKSWNSSHASRGGCSQEALRGTGGAGLFYCFAAD